MARNPDFERNPADEGPVDWDEFASQFGGDTELMRTIGEMFLEFVDDQLRRLEEAVGSGDARTIEATAHAVKGSVAQVFAQAARDLAAGIEARGSGDELEGVEEDLLRLRRQIEAVKSAVATHCRP